MRIFRFFRATIVPNVSCETFGTIDPSNETSPRQSGRGRRGLILGG
jgi:hypothetical protein